MEIVYIPGITYLEIVCRLRIELSIVKAVHEMSLYTFGMVHSSAFNIMFPLTWKISHRTEELIID